MAPFKGHIRILRADNEFLGAADIMPDNPSDVGSESADVPFRIVGVDYEDERKVGPSKKKNVLALKLADAGGRQCKKEWILNKTNGAVIGSMYGAKTEHWEGKWIWLYVDPAVRNPGGGTIAGIRVRAGKKSAPARAQQQEAAQ